MLQRKTFPPHAIGQDHHIGGFINEYRPTAPSNKSFRMASYTSVVRPTAWCLYFPFVHLLRSKPRVPSPLGSRTAWGGCMETVKEWKRLTCLQISRIARQLKMATKVTKRNNWPALVVTRDADGKLIYMACPWRWRKSSKECLMFRQPLKIGFYVGWIIPSGHTSAAHPPAQLNPGAIKELGIAAAAQ
jgi:hypothetical protein